MDDVLAASARMALSTAVSSATPLPFAPNDLTFMMLDCGTSEHQGRRRVKMLALGMLSYFAPRRAVGRGMIVILAPLTN